MIGSTTWFVKRGELFEAHIAGSIFPYQVAEILSTRPKETVFSLFWKSMQEWTKPDANDLTLEQVNEIIASRSIYDNKLCGDIYIMVDPKKETVSIRRNNEWVSYQSLIDAL